ncbi:MAG: hypothetical protein QM752_07930 [Gammaproteobacteria bacterium]
MNYLTFLKHYYIDNVDPERSIAKLSFRTALACAICIVLFQWLGQGYLSAWAGFAAFSFVQNDTQEYLSTRIYFLIGIIVAFTALVYLGITLRSLNVWLFMSSVPLILFLCAYQSCLGFSFFNAGTWAMFTYVMAGSNLTHHVEASVLAKTFLICGIICLLICFFIYPDVQKQKVTHSHERVLNKLLFALRYFQSHVCQTKKLKMLNHQLDKLLTLQEKNLVTYLKMHKASNPDYQQTVLNLGKTLYQICAMVKSIFQFHKHLPANVNLYQDTSLTTALCQVVQDLEHQFKTHHPPNFQATRKIFEMYRDQVTLLRQTLLQTPGANLGIFLEYSRYLYHHFQLLDLLEEASGYITQLEGNI